MFQTVYIQNLANFEHKEGHHFKFQVRVSENH
jgi:hypothetical protein